MRLAASRTVITGGGHGIGRALCERFHREGACVVVADIDFEAARQTARLVGGHAVAADVAQEADVQRLVNEANRVLGGIDLFCSNAGVFVEGGLELSNGDWERLMDVNFRAHLYAARAVLPQMVARGRGYLLQVVSAAGLLTQIGSAPYAVSKHAALALAEWIAIEYGDAGITVSCVCPQGVRTRMLLGEDGNKESFLKAGAIAPEQVAECVVQGVSEERFLILPHPEVAEFFRRKAQDYDRWLRGMRRLRSQVAGFGAERQARRL